MRKFLENRFTVAAILILFASAFAWNTAQGARTDIPWHLQAGFHAAAVAQGLIPAQDSDNQIADGHGHGPGIPPDPWDQAAPGTFVPWDPAADPSFDPNADPAGDPGHGPGIPPDPWDQIRVMPGSGTPANSANQIAHGPGMPPDPWDQIAHGPGMPPDPWDQIAHGPGMPPDPWDQIRVTHGPGMPPDPWDQAS